MLTADVAQPTINGHQSRKWNVFITDDETDEPGRVIAIASTPEAAAFLRVALQDALSAEADAPEDQRIGLFPLALKAAAAARYTYPPSTDTAGRPLVQGVGR